MALILRRFSKSCGRRVRCDMADGFEIGQRVKVKVEDRWRIATVHFVSTTGVYVQIHRTDIFRRYKIEEVMV